MKQEIIRIDLDGVNCYLGKQEDNYVLFDTGGHLMVDKVFDNRREKLEKELKKAGCTPDYLRLIVLTHGDMDHAANASYLREKYKTKIAVHQNDLVLVEKPTIETVMSNFKLKSLPLWLMSMVFSKQIRKLMQRDLNDFEPFKPDILIDDNFSLSEYGFDAEIFHLPGHTSGSVGIITQNGDLISGDTYANIKKPSPSPNALDFHQMDKSIKYLSALKINMVYPGHGTPFQMSEYKNK
jgi:glyoxylase-like metal-dependent hydrolase (beta-lactamase superfamily II)